MRFTHYIFFLILGLLANSVSWASSSWIHSFYTDESSYYLKLFKDGFMQRFRVNRGECGEIQKAEMLIKSRTAPVVFYDMGRKTSSLWPKLYGLNDSDYCWFEVKVSGLDLNKPLENQYVIRIWEKGEQTPYNLTEYETSVIPAGRIKKSSKVNDSDWINLGAMGATPVADGGVFFKIWEPLSERVDLFVDERGPYAMNADSNKRINNKSHVVYLPQAKVGSTYFFQFFKNGQYESLEVGKLNDTEPYFSTEKIDPMARQVTYRRKGAKYNSYVNPRAIVVDPLNYSWRYDSKMDEISDANWQNWLIYQVWPLVFNPEYNSQTKQYRGTFQSFAKRLPYITDLGMTAVEFLPVHESRFQVSWGYAADTILAIESTLGTPDDLRQTADLIHSQGLRVVYDVVLNHVNNSLLREPLSIYVSSSKYFNGYNDWGPIPRYSNIMVKRWITDSLLALMREYRADGFRFDMTKYVHWKNGGAELLKELNYILKMNNPRFHSSAEELGDNAWVTQPITQGGAGFDSQWNDLFKNFFEKGMEHYRPYQRSVDLDLLKSALNGYGKRDDGSYEHFGESKRTVNYLGSHDFIGNMNPIIRLVAPYQYPSNSEYAGNTSFMRVRPLEEPNGTVEKFRLIHSNYTHDVGKMAYGILFTKPGNILFYQGEELANDINIENEWSYLAADTVSHTPSINIDVSRFVKSHAMPWEYLMSTKQKTVGFLSEDEKKMFKGYYRFFKDMVAFRKNYPSLNNAVPYDVKILDDGIISYYLPDFSKREVFLVLVNFRGDDVSRMIKFPEGMDGKNWWKEVINSSSQRYGGQNKKYRNILTGVANSYADIRLAANSFLMFKTQMKPELEESLYLVGTLNNWKPTAPYKLRQAADGQWGVDFEVTESGYYEFKLATSDWDIEIGDVQRDFYLSYRPDAPNFKIFLSKGKNRFMFDSKTFKYSVKSI